MKQTLLFSILLSAVILGLSSCKSKEEKAKEFIKSLDKTQEVLLTLPPTAPDCVFFKEGQLIKCYNMETEQIEIIPYGDINEQSVENIHAGDSCIIVWTINKDEYGDTTCLYKYSPSTKSFSKDLLCWKGRSEIFKDSIEYTGYDADVDISVSNRTLTCTTHIFVEIAAIAEDDDYGWELWSTGSDRVGDVVTYQFTFDGVLVKREVTPYLRRDYEARRSKENSNSTSSYSSRPVYTWRCSKCDETIESMDQPSSSGCHYFLLSSGETRYEPAGGQSHMWKKMGQVR